MTARIFFHVNHLWGAGHFTRIAAIANAVVERGDEATILAGNTPMRGRLDARVRLIELPPIRTPDPSYAKLVDGSGQSLTDALWTARRALIDSALEARPDILVTETFPFGRRKLATELLHLVTAAKTKGASIVASIRDLPTPPGDTRRLDECAARLRDHYDAVLIHGDPAIVPLQDVWPGDIPATTQMTGYVATRVPAAAARIGVIVTAGTGGDAAALLQAAAEARSDNALAAEPWTFVTGPDAADDLLAMLRSKLPSGDTVLRAAPDLPQRIASSVLSISRGGYNTLCETVAAGTRAVVVPFAPPGESEQARRAAAFAAQGLLTHLDEADLTPVSLAAAIETAMKAPAPDPESLSLHGAAASAAWLAERAASR